MDTNKNILEKANAAIVAGDHEGFLAYCADDTTWNFVGEQMLAGKQAVREWMNEAYKTPPRFTVSNLIGEGEFVVALGSIVVPGANGKEQMHSYCDVWRFENGKIKSLNAFVLKPID